MEELRKEVQADLNMQFVWMVFTLAIGILFAIVWSEVAHLPGSRYKALMLLAVLALAIMCASSVESKRHCGMLVFANVFPVFLYIGDVGSGSAMMTVLAFLLNLFVSFLAGRAVVVYFEGKRIIFSLSLSADWSIIVMCVLTPWAMSVWLLAAPGITLLMFLPIIALAVARLLSRIIVKLMIRDAESGARNYAERMKVGNAQSVT